MDLYPNWISRWPKILPQDILSPAGLEEFHSGNMVMNVEFMDKLHLFLLLFNKRFYINNFEFGLELRGWRSWAENLRIDGKLYHPMGVAADVTIEGVSPGEVAEAAETAGFHGIGVYNTFTHIDLRPRLTDHVFKWDNRK
jgi:hypothetical protein